MFHYLKTAEYMQIARIQQEPEVASYFEMHVRGCYIVEEYYHVDQQEDGSKIYHLVKRSRTEADSYNVLLHIKHSNSWYLPSSILEVLG